MILAFCHWRRRLQGPFIIDRPTKTSSMNASSKMPVLGMAFPAPKETILTGYLSGA
jgi:hypothetical protein